MCCSGIFQIQYINITNAERRDNRLGMIDPAFPQTCEKTPLTLTRIFTRMAADALQVIQVITHVLQIDAHCQRLTFPEPQVRHHRPVQPVIILLL